MGIGSWAGLWFGLSIPAILLMYLLKRKFIDTRVPSHLLWDRVLKNMEANRPWQKLQNRLLLWLQLLAVALLVFALLQPFGWVSGSGKGHVIFIADTSGSLSAVAEPSGSPGNPQKDEPQNRLSQMKSQMKQYMKDHAKGSEITLLSIKAEPDVVISRIKDTKRSAEAIDALEPYYGKAAYNETLSLASALTREDQDAEVVLFTDGEWEGGTDQVTFEVPARTILVGGGEVRNIAIEQFGIQAGQKGNEAVVVLGSNQEWDTPVNVHIYGDDKLLRSDSADLKNRSATLVFQDLPEAEVYRAELEDEDGYSADNEAYAFGKSSREPRVLLFTPGNLFLEKALQLTGAEVTKLTLSEEDAASNAQSNNRKKGKAEETSPSPAVPKEKPDLIVVDGKAPGFTSQGEWKEMLAQTPLWSIGGSGTGVKVNGQQAKVSDHPVNRYLTLSGLYFGTVQEQKLPAWAEPIVKIGSAPAVYAGREGGHPRLAFLFQLQDTDLPLSAEFPIMVHNAVSWLSGGEGTGLGRVTAGTTMEIPIAADAVKAQWKIKHTAARNANVKTPDVQQGKNGLSSMQQAPSIPGLYAFEEEDGNGDKTTYMVEVAADPFEGKFVKSEQIDLAAGDSSGEKEAAGVQTQPEKSGGRAGQSQMSLMWLAAAAVLLIILAEWGVYQRGRSV